MIATLEARATTTKLAKGPVFAVAGAVGALLLAVSGRYGYFGDELYFLAAGRHLAWGYADQPPLVPLLARTMDLLAPGSVTVLRLPAIAATVAGVVFTAMIARELGGRRRAQVIAAAAYAVCGQFLGTGHYLATSTLDPFLWTVLTWLVVRWLRTRADGLLLWAGVVTAIAVNVKFLIPAFWLAAGISVLVCGPRELLRRPALWVGALIAAAGALPTVLWQASNGWPQVRMGEAISAEVGSTWGGRLVTVPGFLLAAGLLAGAVLLCYGLARLLRTPGLRFLGWTTLGLAVLVLAVDGRYYYVAGMYPVCWAAAAVGIEARRPAMWWRWIPTWPVFLLGFLLTLPTSLPLTPQSWLTAKPSVPHPVFAVAEVGWPELADSVAREYHAAPNPGHTAIVTGFYWQASALDHYGPSRGLPEPYSPSRGYWTLGTPPESATDVLFVGPDPRPLLGYFAGLRQVGVVDTFGASEGMPLWLATGRQVPWPVLWPQLRDWEG